MTPTLNVIFIQRIGEYYLFCKYNWHILRRNALKNYKNRYTRICSYVLNLTFFLPDLRVQRYLEYKNA